MHFPGYGVRVVVFVPLSITFDTFSRIVENSGILFFSMNVEKIDYCTLCRLHVSKGTIRTKMRLGDVNI